jgi:ATP-dependent RNA helicase DeaD
LRRPADGVDRSLHVRFQNVFLKNRFCRMSFDSSASSLESSELHPLSAPADEASSEIRFRDLNLSEPMLQAIESSGYETATPIQARAIPLLLAGRDVLGQAQTGTGKTAAFAVPMLQRIDLTQVVPQVLVLTPTRELAIQVAEAFERYATGLDGLRVTAIYGGQDYTLQFRDLDRGVHVVVGTPGRVMDHMRRGSLKLDGLRGLVLDEADEMLRMGFAEDVEWVLTQTPSERQVALFSATMPDAIRAIAQQHLRNPAEITIQEGASAAETVRQRFLVVPPPQKQEALARVLEAEPVDGVIVFVKTKSTTEYLAEFLARQGHRVAALSSDVVQKQRERIVENLRDGRLDVIVATDVAARGLDVQRISHVINYDFPFDSESYVHRIGRTGRAGRDGDAILILNTRERHLLRRIERTTGQRIMQMEVPSKRAVNQRRIAKFHDGMTAALARTDLGQFESVVEQFRGQNAEIPVERIAAALAAMVVGDAPLFLTEDLPAPGFREPRSLRDGDRPKYPERRREFDRADDVRATGEREEQSERPQRFERRDDRAPRERAPSGPMETYRVEVGRNHGVKPGNIVGAITNEAGLTSGHIGRIEIFDEHCFVDMLVGMSEETFERLQGVIVGGRPLNLSRAGRDAAPPRRFAEHKFAAKPKFGERKFGEKRFGEKKFGEKKFGAKKFGAKKFDKSRPKFPATPEAATQAKAKKFKKKKFAKS